MWRTLQRAGLRFISASQGLTAGTRSLSLPESDSGFHPARGSVLDLGSELYLGSVLGRGSEPARGLGIDLGSGFDPGL